MSRVVGIINEFLKSLQKPLPELEDVCKDITLLFAAEDTRDRIIRDIVNTLGKYYDLS